MPSAVTNLLIIIATVIITLSAFAIYSTFLSVQGVTFLQEENVISISKTVQVVVSQVSFKGLPPSYNYFNVSYLLWINSPTKYVTVIPFVASPRLNPFYTLPSNSQNASIFFSTPNGYTSLKSFVFSNNVYLPQQSQLIAKTNGVYAYNLTSNRSYILSAKVSNSQIIVLWILYYYQGKWYRLDYTYLNPSNAGVGVYVLSGSGNYVGNSKNTNFTPPHQVANQKGLGFGLWFKLISNATTKTYLFNETITPTDNKNFSILAWVIGNKLYVGIYSSLGNTGNKLSTNQTYLLTLSPNNWYFINFSLGSILDFSKSPGSQLSPSQSVNFTIYNLSSQKWLNTTTLGVGESNGYISIVKFGSSSATITISQAYFVTLQNKPSLTNFYNVSSIMFKDGPLYNNTYNYNRTIVSSNNLYAIGYWYFIYPSYPPPSTIPGILWYWPIGNGQSNTKYPQIYYIPEQGYNTYVLI
ncbi:hypothetical protein SULI_04480 [Saccharolobus solfataricus]|uniref:Uncharacterized protein n=3 Tax=Saccharolobus solfataricus TaxID=2287 RepID=Q97U81_SACS2|nr:hypothetical protein [Saccharolobus solfataricus]AAK43240.1 Hypothetical protein SSO3142 [Saccharolobus solfataricus P2]AKA73268.1 hypothetical protein SULB_0918 [Saccharolobus solfataricus]AKA75967.1 hypothetical protein SULC_0917 [Saccharolobus solfataricus]AKA78660.1 hypothetical protein SULA_0916 [Saccharolobus solfataricus]AZF67735.1 hypothetical protein SULG_04480 [Saccharolobus solfataricus]